MRNRREYRVILDDPAESAAPGVEKVPVAPFREAARPKQQDGCLAATDQRAVPVLLQLAGDEKPDVVRQRLIRLDLNRAANRSGFAVDPGNRLGGRRDAGIREELPGIGWRRRDPPGATRIARSRTAERPIPLRRSSRRPGV